MLLSEWKVGDVFERLERDYFVKISSKSAFLRDFLYHLRNCCSENWKNTSTVNIFQKFTGFKNC